MTFGIDAVMRLFINDVIDVQHGDLLNLAEIGSPELR
jgi:hypothetical protein